ncbi:hypothetical protein JOQ06_000046, partial [Pogonophryne albipinna]
IVDDALLPEDHSSKESTNNTSEAVRSRSPNSESDRTLDTQSGAARRHERTDCHRSPRARFRAGLHAPLNLDTSEH